MHPEYAEPVEVLAVGAESSSSPEMLRERVHRSPGRVLVVSTSLAASLAAMPPEALLAYIDSIVEPPELNIIEIAAKEITLKDMAFVDAVKPEHHLRPEYKKLRHEKFKGNKRNMRAAQKRRRK